MLHASQPLFAQEAEVRDHTLIEARGRHRAGVEAFAQKHYAEAVEAFLSSDALHPTPASAFNVAKAYEAQGEVSRALSFYREYLRRAPAAQDREAVSAKAELLAKRLGERGVQQVTFSAQPAGATVLLDAEPIGTAPITLDLRPGAHRVEFRKSGHAPASVDFELPKDRALDVLATLEPASEPMNALAAPAEKPPVADVTAHPAGIVTPVPRAPSAQVVASPRRSGSVTRTLGFAALGAGVAALGGAVTLEIMRGNAEDEARGATDQVAFSEALERMKTRQTMARVFAGAGGALAALGGVMLVVASGNTERSNKEGVAFACQPLKCQATYARSF
ncbi:MAG TPA: PEGA domain-containing protein [Polyangiales bacterium]|nr:PEGA domain-containing protein [Polyangiales bacterium]